MIKLLQPLAIGSMTCLITTQVLANPTLTLEENLTPFVPSNGSTEDIKGVKSSVEFTEEFVPQQPSFSPSSDLFIVQSDDNPNTNKPQSDLWRINWNLLFGGDLWVNRRVSLQLAYRFYSIDYKNGTGDNAFGFEENFNGPYLSATFHF